MWPLILCAFLTILFLYFWGKKCPCRWWKRFEKSSQMKLDCKRYYMARWLLRISCAFMSHLEVLVHTSFRRNPRRFNTSPKSCPICLFGVGASRYIVHNFLVLCVVLYVSCLCLLALNPVSVDREPGRPWSMVQAWWWAVELQVGTKFWWLCRSQYVFLGVLIVQFLLFHV